MDHLGRVEPLLELLHTLVQLSLVAEAEQHAEEDLPLPALDAGAHPERANLEGAEDGQDVTEGRVVVQLETEPRGIDKDEITAIRISSSISVLSRARAVTSRSVKAFCTVAFSTGYSLRLRSAV